MVRSEIWTPVITWKGDTKYDFTGKYEVSDFGNFRRVPHLVKHNYGGMALKNSREKTPSVNNHGYMTISFWENNRMIACQAQRVVWESFNGKVPYDMQVNHINEDKTDNRLENLNLMTPKENSNWGSRNKKLSKQRPEAGKWVIQLSTNNEILHFYRTIREAERTTGVCSTTITRCCKGKQATSGGYKWVYSI